jgi:hypothetical protein
MSLDWNVVKGPALATHPLSWHSESDGGQHTHRTGPPRHQKCCPVLVNLGDCFGIRSGSHLCTDLGHGKVPSKFHLRGIVRLRITKIYLKKECG